LDIYLNHNTAGLNSPSQRARVMTERWAAGNLYCPRCTADTLEQFKANRPVADFVCPHCAQEFELKSSKAPFRKRLVNGAYQTLVERLKAQNCPDLLLLQYDPTASAVRGLLLIPSQFLTPSVVERRKALGAGARRAGWVGSNIRLDFIPKLGRIELIAGGKPVPKNEVRSQYQKTTFLQEEDWPRRGWIADVLTCIDRLEGSEFTLADIYGFEADLQALHPENQNVRPKIRQQLQKLRDKEIIEFVGKGRYRKRF
jgi:type II restriction enzyme